MQQSIDQSTTEHYSVIVARARNNILKNGRIDIGEYSIVALKKGFIQYQSNIRY
jgi:hypothetical protein